MKEQPLFAAFALPLALLLSLALPTALAPFRRAGDDAAQCLLLLRALSNYLLTLFILDSMWPSLTAETGDALADGASVVAFRSAVNAMSSACHSDEALRITRSR
jgi:hypothetical protein